MRHLKFLLIAAIAMIPLTSAARAGTLDEIKERDRLICGVSTGMHGLSAPDNEGNWSGLDTDICRALAASILGDASKVEFYSLPAQQRFTALQSGVVDLLARNTTYTLSRDTVMGLNFGPTTFYDGQGFIVPTELGIKSAHELDGASICVYPGSTTELNLTDFFNANKMSFESVVIGDLDQLTAAFFAGRCDVYSGDKSGLAGMRDASAPNPEDYVILPETISKEPLAPAVRHGDDVFYDVVTWTIYALIEAEELGINSQNIDTFLTSENPDVKRLLGVLKGNGESLGLDEKWAYNAISQAGNYAEIFERNLGKQSSIQLDRGLNALWKDGGLMYAPPLR